LFDHLKVGKLGERLAKLFLESLGYKILTTNWRFRFGEIDIVCEKEDILVFVEVKTRRNSRFGRPEEYFDKKKQKRLLKAISKYLSQNKLWDRSCRVDVISINLEPTKWHIEHFKNVFEVSKAMDSSHTYWQPW